MKLATKKQADTYLEEGRSLVNNTNASFSDVKNISMLAIAEYLANKDGLTIYASAVR
mgnify:CR=1 FL=1